MKKIVDIKSILKNKALDNKKIKLKAEELMKKNITYDGVLDINLEDETVSNMLYEGVQKKIKLKNVTFEDCIFKNVDFNEIEFDGVKLILC